MVVLTLVHRSQDMGHQTDNIIFVEVSNRFRLDALALSVIATATWLAGWLGDWLSVTAGIVSKRLNVSENFSTV